MKQTGPWLSNKKINVFSFLVSSVILALIIISLAAATFIESGRGSEISQKWVYGSTWFEILLFLFAVNVIGSLFSYRSFLWKKISVPLFHLAFVLIVIGALFTRYTGIEGSVRLREGETTNQVEISQGKSIRLPFELQLTDFLLERYPGSDLPSSYSSFVLVNDLEKGRSFDFHIYMNHILKYRGWRFFQTSYDHDEMGTVLTASHDIIGTPITYSGYFIAVLAMLASLIFPGTFFRRQLRQLKTGRAAIIILALTPLAGFSFEAQQATVVPQQQAQEFGRLVVQDAKGRMKTVNTLNREFMQKIYGSETFGKLSADQVALSMLAFPDYWSQVELIKIKSPALQEILHLEHPLISYQQMFDAQGNYLLEQQAHRAFMKSRKEQTKTDKAIVELDEKMNILQRFLTGDVFSIFPVEGAENNKWYSTSEAFLLAPNSEDSLFLRSIVPVYISEIQNGIGSGNFDAATHYLNAISQYQKTIGTKIIPSEQKIDAELFYNHLGLFGRLKMVCGIAGLIFLVLQFISLFKGLALNRKIDLIFLIFAILLFSAHSLGIGLRWYIGGFVPLSNAYETMLFISWVSLLSGILLSRKHPIVLGLSLILGFAFLMVAGLNNNNPEIGNLVPVLKSPWLSIHVAVITSSYALFALVMMVAMINLLVLGLSKPSTFAVAKIKTEQMTALMQVLLIIGLYLLTIGTIFGAVWANESWGRYWGWDPKETWALISILVYAFVSHMRLIPKLNEEFWFNLASFWAFASILMTFFGVNYFLSGMHSYAGTSNAQVPAWLIYLVVLLVMFSIYCGLRYLKLKKITLPKQPLP